ncbi:DUF58 domain-containing protein [Pleionea sediminis]|uniref:DUF58 domain-containing protein n=1 Tax=Pleionea sediminis TaxID=2569479 RepID=UPI0011853460|nr:DUF58 domain-containing protein [Pleionea sediminis]
MSIKNAFLNKIEVWQKARAPRANTIALNQKNTYIFPTRYGFLLLLTVILMGVGATNYQNNLIFVATFLSMTIGLLAILLTYNNLVGLTIACHPPKPAFCHENLRLSLTVYSKKEHYAIGVGFKGQNIQTLDIESESENRQEISLPCQRRGEFLLPKVQCKTYYPFGFLQAWSWLFFDTHYIVYPTPIEPDSYNANNAGRGSENEEMVRVGTEDYYGLKTYQKGDSLSRIHWKSFASGKGLQTKQFVDYQSNPYIFDFDAFETRDTEKRLSYLCYLCLQANKDNSVFGLQLPGQMIEPEQGDEHLHRCLTALAKL